MSIIFGGWRPPGQLLLFEKHSRQDKSTKQHACFYKHFQKPLPVYKSAELAGTSVICHAAILCINAVNSYLMIDSV